MCRKACLGLIDGSSISFSTVVQSQNWRENVIALGPSGTGKTHVALGLGLAACQKGLTVTFTTAAALVNELMEARDEVLVRPIRTSLCKGSNAVLYTAQRPRHSVRAAARLSLKLDRAVRLLSELNRL